MVRIWLWLRFRLWLGLGLGLRFRQGILKGKYHCTIDLLFDWFGISCMITDYFGFICKAD